jgi:hypothetical protein
MKPTHVSCTTVKREKSTIEKMITIYCRGHRHSASGMCVDCEVVLRYAYERIDRCPFNASNKPACGLCRTNCFTPDMQLNFNRIMRYAGPRMMIRHPFLTLAHIRDAFKGMDKGYH